MLRSVGRLIVREGATTEGVMVTMVKVPFALVMESKFVP